MKSPEELASEKARDQEINKLVAQALEYVKSNDFGRAEALTVRVLEENPKDEIAWYLRVISLHMSGRLEEAEKIASDALKLLPDNVLLFVHSGLVALSREHPDKAIDFFDEALKREPKNVIALKSKTTSLRVLLRFGEAEKAADEALKLVPDDASLLIERALVDYDQKNYEKAIELFDEALKRQPNDADALKLRINSLRILLRFEEAQKTADEALKLVPDNASLLIERALVDYDQKNYEKAIGLFDEGLKREPKNVDVLKWKITSLRILLRFEEAQKAADDALKLDPDNASLLIERATIDLDQNEYERAIELLDKALKSEPTNVSAATKKIASLMIVQRLEEAQKAADDALRFAPENASLLFARGLVEYGQKQYESAVELFDKALKGEPKDVETLKWKITSLRTLRRFEDARQAADEALKLAPDSASLLLERALIDYDQKAYEKAIELLDKLLKREPNDVDALKWKITLLRRLRRFEEAQQAADDALKLAPDNALLLVERAFVEYDQEKYEKAIELFDEALKREPNDVGAHKWKIASLRTLRRFEAADKAAVSALTLKPKEPTLLIERGSIWFDQRKFDRAVDLFDLAIASDRRNEEALEWKSLALRAQQKTDEAIKFLEGALPQFPKSASLRVQRGWLYLEKEDLGAAERLFSEAAALAAPDDNSPLLGRVETLVRQYRSDQAISLLRTNLTAFPNDLDLRTTLGWTYLNRNDPLSAQTEFETVLARTSGNTGALNGLGAVYFNQEEYEKAEDLFRRVAVIEPHEPAWYTNLAWSLARQQPAAARKTRYPLIRTDLKDMVSPLGSPQDRPDCLTQADEFCRKALDLDPNRAVAFGCLGVIAFKRGQLRESEDHFLQSIRASKRDGSYVDLAALYVVMGRYEEAESHLRVALELDRNDVLAHIERGNLLLQREKTKEAIREFRQAAGIDPNSESAQRALAVALIPSGALDEAEKLLRSAIRRMDRAKRWSLHLTLGQLLEKRGDETEDPTYYDEALAEINKAIDLKRDEPQPHFQAGILRSKTEDYGAAVRSFKRCLRLDKSHFEAERNLSRIKRLLPGETVRRLGTAGGISFAAISLSLLGILWLNFFNPYFFTAVGVKISDTMLITMTPILLGLIVVGLLLPALIRLKLPGVEADLSQPKLKEALAVGPKGAAGFGSSLPNISSGPR